MDLMIENGILERLRCIILHERDPEVLVCVIFIALHFISCADMPVCVIMGEGLCTSPVSAATCGVSDGGRAHSSIEGGVCRMSGETDSCLQLLCVCVMS